MKGTVLGFDATAGRAVLRAEDGKRYSFSGADWRDARPARKGDLVDFEPEGEIARDIFLVPGASGMLGGLGTGSSTDDGSSLAEGFARSPAGGIILGRPVLTFAILVLIACFVGAYRIGDISLSLVAVPELISRMAAALDGLVAGTGADPAPRTAAAFARVLLLPLFLIYLVPVLAAWTAWREFAGRSSARLARTAGLLAVILPVFLPLVVVLIVQIWILPSLPAATPTLGRAGVVMPAQVFDLLRLYGPGVALVVLAGAGLFAAADGRIRPYRQGHVDNEPVPPPPPRAEMPLPPPPEPVAPPIQVPQSAMRPPIPPVPRTPPEPEEGNEPDLPDWRRDS